MNEEFLTVADFAATVGVTPQAVYRRLEKDLSPFVKVIQGQKYLSTDAKSLFKVNQVEKRDSRTVEFLLSQLAEKDQMIEQQRTALENQSQQIEKLQGHIMEQSKELTGLLRKQNQLQENYQVLLKEFNVALSSGLQPETTVDQLDHAVKQSVENFVEYGPEEQNPSKKTGLFARLFRR